MGRVLSLLKEQAAANADRPAIAEGGRSIGYRELPRRIGRMASALSRLSEPSESGEVVYGLVMDQTLDSALLLLAALATEHAVLPVDDRLTAFELDRIGQSFPVSFWIVPDTAADRFHACRMRVMRYAAICAEAEAKNGEQHFPDAARERRESMLYQMTSGTTGEAKLACLPLSAVLREGRAYRDWFGYTSRDVVLSTVPLNHLYGMTGALMAALCAGGTLIVCRNPTPRKAIRLLREVRATIVLGVPPFYRLLADSELLRPEDFVSLRFAISSGSALPPDVMADFQARTGRRVLPLYGSTETGAVAAHHPERLAEEGSCGFLLPGVTAVVQEGGTLAVSSPSLFAGYWRKDGFLDSPLGGWYATDDLAAIGDGQLVLKGRKPRFINVAGRKVSPSEVESVIRLVPAVAEVKVTGRTDPLHGEVVVARIVLAAGAEPPLVPKQIKAYLKQHLAEYKWPHAIDIVDRLPGTWKESYSTGETETREREVRDETALD